MADEQQKKKRKGIAVLSFRLPFLRARQSANVSQKLVLLTVAKCFM